MSPQRPTLIGVLLACATGLAVAGQTGISKDDRVLYKRMLSDLRRDLEDNATHGS